jgi:hypothetical protein
MKKIVTILLFACTAKIASSQVCLTPTTYTPGGSLLVSADFNNDGKIDLVNGYGSSLKVMLGNGLGSFSIGGAASVANISNIMTADFNKDGNADLAVANYSGSSSIIILLGTGTGAFGSPMPFASNLYPWGMTSNDFNGDGNPDLAVTCGGPNTLSVFMGDGAGNFGSKVDYTFGDHTTYGSVGGVVSKDFNNDGKADIALSAIDTLVVFLGDGIGGFGSPSLFPGGPSSNGSYLCANDFDLDGITDIAGADGSSDQVSVWLGTATGSFGSAIKIHFGSPIQLGPIATADYNSDGKPDLIVSNSQSAKISLLLGTGTGGFVITTSFPDADVPQQLVSADFNSDGKPDLAVGNQQGGGNMMVFLNVPAPNLNLNSSNPHSLCSNASATLTASGATTYTWSSNTGISNPNYTVTTAVVSPSVSTTYSVIAQTNGCRDSASFHYNMIFPQTPDICMVTTDSANNFNYNIICWDKTTYSNVDSFIVYRKDAISSSYLRIGAVSKNSLSEFIDTAFTIGGPNGGNPIYSSWTYKLAIKDTCGNLGAMSPYHQTMFIQQSGSNFSWNAYTVEIGQANPVTGYSFVRDNNNTGTWNVLVNTTGNSATDPNFSSYPNGNWRVDAIGFNCTPSLRLANNSNTQTLLKKAHSNTNKPATMNVKQQTNLLQMFVYPNPSNGNFTIETGENKNSKVEIYSLLGELVYKSNLQKEKTNINLQNVNKGTYLVHIISDNGTTVKRIIVE